MCDECLAISRDLRDAIAELRLSAGLARPEAARAVEALRGGTEEDALVVEEFFSAFRQQAYLPGSRITRAMGMKFAHERRTGHRVSLEPPGR
jgi:hypothetical protein